ncbi:MAG: prephenate dehydrogenase/arogenate dehydrogenase family protein [Phycisphaerales bacterium]|nr:MAG: prephenate dehydrogenase/arogenate dehydrogenase family protein [Phycisphaerales bacterium]
MQDLRQVSVVGLGLLGGSIALSVLRSFTGVKVVGYSHRGVTRRKARELGVATEVADDLGGSVSEADLVILATPIRTFEGVFERIAGALRDGCIVTDVGSTKVLAHRWAAAKLPKSVRYVGSHPIAGSEQRGVEYARDDLFERAMCILTATKRTDAGAARRLGEFWSQLGCFVKSMTPREHDRVFANVSHLPHITAAALINANDGDDLKFAGKGFIDTSRVASGPANIWADVLMTNSENAVRGIDRIMSELSKIRRAIESKNGRQIEGLLEKARDKRRRLIDYKIEKRELIQ